MNESNETETDTGDSKSVSGWMPVVLRREWLPVLLAFGWFFSLMACYNLLRPIREAFGSQRPELLNWLFLGTFVVMLAAVPLYGKLVNLLPRGALVQCIFHFLAACLAAFAIAVAWSGPEPPQLLGWIYFVWVSVFILLAGSLFWTVMSDLFREDQGRRLFGIIASGATTGAICGSTAAKFLVSQIGLAGLLIAALILLECGLLFAVLLQRSTRHWPKQQQADRPRGSIWQGFTEIANSRYLQTICLFIFLFTFCGTAVYMQLSTMAKEAMPIAEDRVAFFANLNLYTQSGTLLLQLLVVSQLMKRAGLAIALSILPVVCIGCLIWLGTAPTILAISVVDVLFRATAYGITVPSREVLFTVINRESRFKSKYFIDTALIRGTDSLSSNAFFYITALLPAVAMINWMLLPLACCWLVTAFVLGKMQRRMAAPATLGTREPLI